MPILSIIVPTKNRYKFIKAIIDKFMQCKFVDDEIELVIQDNSDSNDEIVEFLKDKREGHVVYNYTPGNLSVSDNFSIGIEASRGEYICMLGDDDGFTKYIREIAIWMHRNDIESVIFNKAHYKWPDALKAKGKRRIFELETPSLAIHKCEGQLITFTPMNELLYVAQQGFTQLGNMPQVYHGIVKRDCFNKIKKLTGTYFPGASPDMANGVALSLVVESHVLINAPIVFSGQNAVSAGGHGLRKKHVGKIGDITFLPKNIESIWDSRIPRIWTAQTIYAETAIESLREMHRLDVIDNLNWEYLYARFIVDHPDLYKLVIPLIFQVNKGKLWKSVVKQRIRLLGRYPMYVLRKLTNQDLDEKYNDIEDTIEAASVIEQYIDSNQLIKSYPID